MPIQERDFIFSVATALGGVMVDFENVAWDEASKPRITPQSEYAFDAFVDWLHATARNARGYGLDLDTGFAPQSLHEALTCAVTVGGSDVTGFEFLGEAPVVEDDADPEDEPILESAQVRTPLTVEENIQRGREAMSRVIERRVNEPRAMYRKGLGWIAFFWGKAGGEPPKCKGGHGISKILAKREWEGRSIEELIGQSGVAVAYKLVEVIATGSFGTIPGRRIRVQKKDFVVFLSKEMFGKEVVWLLTGFREVETQTRIKSPDEPAVGPETGGPTHHRPTRSASGGGSGAFSSHTPGSGTGSEDTSEVATEKAFGKDILEAAIDDAALDAATHPGNDLPEPTQAQKEAGNYAKAHVRLCGLDIAIENPAGSSRSGVDKGGKAWSVTMKSHYGYVRGSVGRDKDHVDVFVKPGTTDKAAAGCPVFVVDQVLGGKFDEHKILIGFDTEAEAEAAYMENYDAGWPGLGAISGMSMTAFKLWVTDQKETKHPVAWEPGDEPILESAPVGWRDRIMASTTWDELAEAYRSAIFLSGSEKSVDEVSTEGQEEPTAIDTGGLDMDGYTQVDAKTMTRLVEEKLAKKLYLRGFMPSLKHEGPGDFYRSGKVDVIRVYPSAGTAQVGYWYTNKFGEEYTRQRVAVADILISEKDAPAQEQVSPQDYAKALTENQAGVLRAVAEYSDLKKYGNRMTLDMAANYHQQAIRALLGRGLIEMVSASNSMAGYVITDLGREVLAVMNNPQPEKAEPEPAENAPMTEEAIAKKFNLSMTMLESVKTDLHANNEGFLEYFGVNHRTTVALLERGIIGSEQYDGGDSTTFKKYNFGRNWKAVVDRGPTIRHYATEKGVELARALGIKGADKTGGYGTPEKEAFWILREWVRLNSRGMDKIPDSMSANIGQANGFLHSYANRKPEECKAAAAFMRANADILSDKTELHPDRINAIAGELEQWSRISPS